MKRVLSVCLRLATYTRLSPKEIHVGLYGGKTEHANSTHFLKWSPKIFDHKIRDFPVSRGFECNLYGAVVH